jgi:hypothetical protein
MICKNVMHVAYQVATLVVCCTQGVCRLVDKLANRRLRTLVGGEVFGVQGRKLAENLTRLVLHTGRAG